MSARASTLGNPPTMNSTEPIHVSEAFERDGALAEFLAAVRTAAQESEAAVVAAKPALARIASAITRRDNGQALRLRALLVSLYSGGQVCAELSGLWHSIGRSKKTSARSSSPLVTVNSDAIT